MMPSFHSEVFKTCILTLSLSLPALADVSYRIIDLGTLVTGVSSQGIDINDRGQVTGYSTVNGAEHQHAILYDGTMHDLGTLGGKDSFGLGINASGQVTGQSEIEGGAAEHAFLYDGTTMHDIGTLGGDNSSGSAINDAGHVTGQSAITPGSVSDVHVFLYDGTTMHDIGTTLVGYRSGGSDINASDQVTGSVFRLDETLALFYDGTTMHEIAPDCSYENPGGPLLFGNGINGGGMVTGLFRCYDDPADARTGYDHAFIYDGLAWQDIGALFGMPDPTEFSWGYDINDSGQVVGRYLPAGGSDGDDHAFLYDGTTVYDLCDLVDCVGAGWDHLRWANAINNHGSITGLGVIGGNEHAFLVIAQLRVDIDFRPFAPINVINPRSGGAIWVAVLSHIGSEPGSPGPFDPPFIPSSQIDIQSVEFGPQGASPVQFLVKDLNQDGLGDLLMEFMNAETGITEGDTEVMLTGKTVDGQWIAGTDAVQTVGEKPIIYCDPKDGCKP